MMTVINGQFSRLLDRQGGVVTSAQALTFLSRRGLEAAVNQGLLQKVWYGIYGSGDVNTLLRLRGLDLATGTTVAVCLATAAAAYGFDTENVAALHVLNPRRRQLRSADGLFVHRREGAPLTTVHGDPPPSRRGRRLRWHGGCAEAARLATLDAALRSGHCSRAQLCSAAAQQSGRRGIVAVRGLLPIAAPQAESPMESEARWS